MKVLHVLTSVNTGGPECMLARLLESSPGRRNETAVLTLTEPGPFADRIRDLGVRFYTLRMNRNFWSPIAAARLARIVNTFAPDIIHGWMYRGSLAASVGAMMMGKPTSVVWNIRNSLADSSQMPSYLRKYVKAAAWLSSRPEAIIYNSLAASLQHQTFGFDAGNSVIIPNGFDCSLNMPDDTARARLREEFGIAPGALVVGHVAAYQPMKDHRTLIEAVAQARARGLDLHLLLIGEGLDQPPQELARMLQQHLPADRVSTSDCRLDLHRLLPGMDLLAVSSAWGEGFSNVIGEGLASGVPVVATDVGDSGTIVGQCGRIVVPGRAADFAGALFELGSMSADERRAMGMKGRERVMELYSLDQVARRYNELHRNLVEDVRHLGTPVINTHDPLGEPAE